MYAILKIHHHEEEVLHISWTGVNTVSDWVDWKQTEQGQRFLCMYQVVPHITGLSLQGLLSGSDVRIYPNMTRSFEYTNNSQRQLQGVRFSRTNWRHLNPRTTETIP